MKTLLALLAFSALTLGASAKVSENFSQTYPLAANGTISLDNVNGSIEVVAWDKAEVLVEAVKSSKDDEALSHLHIKIEASAKKLVIKTEYEKKWKFWENAQAEVRYKLMVPAGATLDKIGVVNADVQITGVKGSVKVDSVNGSIEAEGLAGEGDFDTVNGSITVSYATMPSDDISLDTVNGRCTVKLPANAAFKLEADTVNGRTSCDFPITLEKSGKHDLHGTVNGGGIKVKLDSVNGGLAVEKAG
jgi:DUF4097 and DUF4098 domain-containing protein YvlB